MKFSLKRPKRKKSINDIVSVGGGVGGTVRDDRALTIVATVPIREVASASNALATPGVKQKENRPAGASSPRNAESKEIPKKKAKKNDNPLKKKKVWEIEAEEAPPKKAPANKAVAARKAKEASAGPAVAATPAVAAPKKNAKKSDMAGRLQETAAISIDPSNNKAKRRGTSKTKSVRKTNREKLDAVKEDAPFPESSMPLLSTSATKANNGSNSYKKDERPNQEKRGRGGGNRMSLLLPRSKPNITAKKTSPIMSVGTVLPTPVGAITSPSNAGNLVASPMSVKSIRSLASNNLHSPMSTKSVTTIKMGNHKKSRTSEWQLFPKRATSLIQEDEEESRDEKVKMSEFHLHSIASGERQFSGLTRELSTATGMLSAQQSQSEKLFEELDSCCSPIEASRIDGDIYSHHGQECDQEKITMKSPTLKLVSDNVDVVVDDETFATETQERTVGGWACFSCADWNKSSKGYAAINDEDTNVATCNDDKATDEEKGDDGKRIGWHESVDDNTLGDTTTENEDVRFRKNNSSYTTEDDRTHQTNETPVTHCTVDDEGTYQTYETPATSSCSTSYVKGGSKASAETASTGGSRTTSTFASMMTHEISVDGAMIYETSAGSSSESGKLSPFPEPISSAEEDNAVLDLTSMDAGALSSASEMQVSSHTMGTSTASDEKPTSASKRGKWFGKKGRWFGLAKAQKDEEEAKGEVTSLLLDAPTASVKSNGSSLAGSDSTSSRSGDEARSAASSVNGSEPSSHGEAGSVMSDNREAKGAGASDNKAMSSASTDAPHTTMNGSNEKRLRPNGDKLDTNKKLDNNPLSNKLNKKGKPRNNKLSPNIIDTMEKSRNNMILSNKLDTKEKVLGITSTPSLNKIGDGLSPLPKEKPPRIADKLRSNSPLDAATAALAMVLDLSKAPSPSPNGHEEGTKKPHGSPKPPPPKIEMDIRSAARSRTPTMGSKGSRTPTPVPKDDMNKLKVRSLSPVNMKKRSMSVFDKYLRERGAVAAGGDNNLTTPHTQPQGGLHQEQEQEQEQREQNKEQQHEQELKQEQEQKQQQQEEQQQEQQQEQQRRQEQQQEQQQRREQQQEQAQGLQQEQQQEQKQDQEQEQQQEQKQGKDQDKQQDEEKEEEEDGVPAQKHKRTPSSTSVHGHFERTTEDRTIKSSPSTFSRRSKAWRPNSPNATLGIFDRMLSMKEKRSGTPDGSGSTAFLYRIDPHQKQVQGVVPVAAGADKKTVSSTHQLIPSKSPRCTFNKGGGSLSVEVSLLEEHRDEEEQGCMKIPDVGVGSDERDRNNGDDPSLTSIGTDVLMNQAQELLDLEIAGSE